MNKDLIISKYKELVDHYEAKPIAGMRVTKDANDWIDKKYNLIEELSLLQEQEKKEPVADIDALIEKYIKEELPESNSSFHWQAEGAASLRDFKEWIKRQNKGESVDQSGMREELIKFACRNDKYQITNIRNTEVPAFLEMLRKEHERSVDEYLKSNQCG